jgi:signal transduction histidine kinase
MAPAGKPGSKPKYTPMRRGIFNTDAVGESTYDHADTAPADQWPLAEALRSQRPILVGDCAKLIEGYPVRVWDELPTSAIVLPISSSDGSSPSTVLVIGISCRLPFGTDYQAFFVSACHQPLLTVAASVRRACPLTCTANIRLRLQLSSLYGAARYTEEEAKRAEDLVDLQRAQKLLFANVSHELVTPLSLVAGPLDDVLAEMPAGRQRDGLNMARRNVQRLSRLVGMLMDLSSLEAGHMASCFRRVNLGEVTRNVAAMYKQASDAAHLTYVVDCDMENRDVYIDRDKYVRQLCGE